MPIIHIHLLEGRSVDQKRALVEKVTQAVCDTVSVTPEHVKIVLSDMARHDYATAGVLHLDKDRK